MTEEQKQILKDITKELGGKIEFWFCSDKFTEHQKVVIEYGHAKKDR